MPALVFFPWRDLLIVDFITDFPKLYPCHPGCSSLNTDEVTCLGSFHHAMLHIGSCDGGWLLSIRCSCFLLGTQCDLVVVGEQKQNGALCLQAPNATSYSTELGFGCVV